MTRDYHSMISDLIDSGIGDRGRLEFMLDCLNSDKPLYNTDMIYLESAYDQLESKIKTLTKPSKTPIAHSQKALISDDILNDIISNDRHDSENIISDDAVIINKASKNKVSANFLTSFVMGLSISLSVGLTGIVLFLLVV